MLLIGVPLPLLRGVVPDALVDYFSNLLLAVMSLILGAFGGPYYAWKVRNLIKNIKGEKAKETLDKIMRISAAFAILSWTAVLNYASAAMRDRSDFGARMQLFIGTHTLMSIGKCFANDIRNALGNPFLIFFYATYVFFFGGWFSYDLCTWPL